MANPGSSDRAESQRTRSYDRDPDIYGIRALNSCRARQCPTACGRHRRCERRRRCRLVDHALGPVSRPPASTAMRMRPPTTAMPPVASDRSSSGVGICAPRPARPGRLAGPASGPRHPDPRARNGPRPKTRLPLGDFDVLAQLALAGGELRMTNLATKMFSSRSAATRRIDHMVEEGLVRRKRSEADGRGVVIRVDGGRHGSARRCGARPPGWGLPHVHRAARGRRTRRPRRGA